MSLAQVAPIAVTLFNPNASWTSQPNAAGVRTASLSGFVEWDVAHALSELCVNGVRSVGFAGAAGVLEYVDFDDDLLRPFRGWYLLHSCNLAADQPSSLTGLVGIGLDATHLGPREPVLVRSARPKTNDFSLTAQSVAVYPFAGDHDDAGAFLFTPGGDTLERNGEDGPVLIHVGTVTDDTDELEQVVPVGVPLDLATSEWVSDRSVDVRANDRREERDVHGPHVYAATSDAQLRNGLLRVTVGPRGFRAYVAVHAFVAGIWEDIGTVTFGLSSADVLQTVRLVRVTPEEGVLGLAVRNVGETLVTLRRGERMLRVAAGRGYGTQGLHARWLGTPPPDSTDALPQAAGVFGQGLDLDVGLAQFAWPAGQSKDAWSFTFRWIPDDASLTQPDSALFGLFDSAGQVGKVEFVTATNVIRWTLGAQTLETGPLTWADGDPVFVRVTFSTVTGMALTTRTGAIAAVHVANAAHTNPGTTDATYHHFLVGAMSDGTLAGAGTAGSGVAGGVVYAGGIIDHPELFEDALTDAEAATRAAATSGLDDLPSPEGRLIWWASFDPRTIPAGSAYATGRRYEATVQGGSTRNPDSLGFTRALAALRSASYGSGDGLAIAALAEHEVAAYLATTTTHDDVADLQAQFAASQFQEVRVR